MNNTDLELNLPCPICGGEATLVRTLESHFLREHLTNYFPKSLPSTIEIADYRLMRCSQCTLEYGIPAMPGTETLYDWLAVQKDYYPNNRWEWDAVLNLTQDGQQPQRVIEVGCGDGAFLLKILKRWSQVEVLGLDTSPAAVEKCRHTGVPARVADLCDFLSDHDEVSGKFDIAVAFHCLEHVQKPADFVRLMCSLVRPGGRVFLSTPLSPMSLEVEWFDALNHPPHHMTRWNRLAYNKLAQICGADLTLHTPAPIAPTRLALCSLAAAVGGRRNLFSTRHQLRIACKHPIRFLQHIWWQVRRLSWRENDTADVVLAELRLG